MHCMCLVYYCISLHSHPYIACDKYVAASLHTYPYMACVTYITAYLWIVTLTVHVFDMLLHIYLYSFLLLLEAIWEYGHYYGPCMNYNYVCMKVVVGVALHAHPVGWKY